MVFFSPIEKEENTYIYITVLCYRFRLTKLAWSTLVDFIAPHIITSVENNPANKQASVDGNKVEKIEFHKG